MGTKYLHLIQNQNFVPNLKRLIGDQPGHKIVIFESSRDNEKVKKMVLASKAVFIHFLDYPKAKFINSIEKRFRVIWFFWGGDGYYLGKFDRQFLLSKTRRIRFQLNLRNFFKGGWRDLLKMSLGSWSDFIYPNREVLKAAKNTDIIVPVIPQDYRKISSFYHLSAEMFHVNYINDVFSSRPEINEANNKKNVLLGNSASFSGNHIEMIDYISNFRESDICYILPLSYGNEFYADFIDRYARERIGGRVKILREILPLEEYRTLLESCDTLIMNHCRQQGLGNIIMALWYEITIFLNRRSGLFEYLSEHGFHILDTDSYEPGRQLEQKKRGENKERLYKVFGPDQQREKFTRLLERIDQL